MFKSDSPLWQSDVFDCVAEATAACDWSGNDDVDGGQFNQSRPSFKPTPSNVSVSLGQTAVLRCSVDNLGDRTVSLMVWFHVQLLYAIIAHENTP